MYSLLSNKAPPTVVINTGLGFAYGSYHFRESGCLVRERERDLQNLCVVLLMSTYRGLQVVLNVMTFFLYF